MNSTVNYTSNYKKYKEIIHNFLKLAKYTYFSAFSDKLIKLNNLIHQFFFQ